MKKKNVVLSVLLVLCTMLVPSIANATEIYLSEDSAGTKTTEGGATITCPKNANGTIATCYIGVSVTGGTLKEFNVTANLKNLAPRSGSTNGINGRNEWTAKRVSSTATSVVYNLSHANGFSAGDKGIVAQIVFDVTDPSAECSIELTNFTPVTPEENPTPKCKVEDGKDGQKVYYCENGQVCTKEEYDEKCTTQENPQTGSFLPYAVIIGGIAVAAGLYMITKKNKIYHI